MGGRLGVWKGVLWVFFVKGVLPGYLDGFFSGRVNGCELTASDSFSCGILNGPCLGDLGVVLVGKFRWTLAG